MTADPNMKCVCGFRRFRESIRAVDDDVEQWVRFDDGTYGGFGSTPFGTFFGSGAGGAWGLFELTVARTHQVLACESCGRARSDKVIGGNGVFGSYLLGNSIFVLISDASLLACLRVRFRNEELDITVDVSPTVYLGTPLPLVAPAPAETAPTPPAGATIAGLIRAVLPDVDEDAEFVVSLVDVCAGTETLLTTINLESTVQIHYPNEADLNGIPRTVVQQGLRITMPSAQPSGAGSVGIPFDWCRTVMEYDARFGALPLASGWTQFGAVPDSVALEPGGTLLFETSALSSAYLQEVTLPTAFTSIYMYSRYWVQSSAVGDERDGLSMLADGAPGASVNYRGMLMRGRPTSLSTRTLEGATANILLNDLPPGWVEFMTAMSPTEANGMLAGPETYGVFDKAARWGPGGFGGVSPTVRAAFGCFRDSAVLIHLRNFVVSEPGRFMRSYFKSYAAAATQTLRLYFVGDVDGVGGQTARIKVRYGSGALGVNPYALGSAFTVSATAFFNTRNVIVEVPLSLTGLAAQQPFWFSVEREWDHADDLTQSTIHLIEATVRSS